MSFRSIYYLIVFILFSVHASAQIENTNALRIDAEKEPKETTFSLPSANSGIPTESNFKLYSSSVDSLYANRMQRPFSMNNDNGLLKPNLNNPIPKYFTKDKEVKEEYKSDQYLGDYKSNGQFVQLIYRDHQFVDGDLVRIYINDDVIRSGVYLGGTFEGIKINLIRGFNKIDIEALNQGTSGPNTAEFHLYDDQGNLLTANEWNLTTGVKATLIVVKE